MSRILASYRSECPSHIADGLHGRLTAHGGATASSAASTLMRPDVDIVDRLDESVGSIRS